VFVKLAHLIVHRRRLVLTTTLAIIVGGLALSPLFQSGLRATGYETPGSESYRAQQLIAARTGFAEEDTLVVSSAHYHAQQPAFRHALATAIATVRRVDPAIVVIGPGRRGGGLVSRDGHVVTATVELRGDGAERQKVSDRLQTALAAAAPRRFSAGVTGDSPLLSDLTHIETSEMFDAELFGLPIAAVILLFAFGSVVAAGVPLILGLSGLFVSFGVIAALMTVMRFNAFVESMMAAIGIAIGIDYALLMVRRFREERAAGGSDEEIVGRTLSTAGRTIMFSGIILSTSLVPLIFTDLPFFDDTAVAIIVVVLTEVALLLTFLPALLLRLGPALDRGTISQRLIDARLAPAGSGGWYRWAKRVMGRPWPVMIVGVALLLLAATPVLGLKTGIDLNARAMQNEPSVRPLETVQRHFPAAGLGPVEVAVQGHRVALERSAVRARHLLASRLDYVSTTPLGRDAVLVSGTLRVASDSSAAERLVRQFRLRLAATLPAGATAEVGGVTAETVDYADKADRITPIVIVTALVLSFVLLLWLFRSPVLAAKAIVMNLLSIGAAFGLTVLVFQHGHGEKLLGFTSPGYIQAWMPLVLFLVLFGLSMDYEVFMVSRIREEWERTGDTVEAVARGLERTGGIVTSAATIMVAIFASFLLVVIPEMKQMGFGLAAAVLIDATLVRAMLVPAFMRLAGRWNWWMPAGLDQRLPKLQH
jgi:putative drug exporter of the RND superfamily